ncbi:hypothetical protein DICPUDRAFT_38203 [Dictyostelium purpureum]|uniref:TRAF-type domain-containing protein n=1 Tax=Dictyostelium purpureum TaxID=5786 RepID=F0ZU13_DICPU|nr:uncharacterized protein DICPUDRAFT_38203 [Dictyostelium purpureum]EGC32564.1 hypothetical protein DICPUDRAFT_38203 [Dictyostelium purpureum]|eukprot:XP_003290901.1 hypothetical protein DICPUDRAFT_38203 [Dictyostelium purpureum]
MHILSLNFDKILVIEEIEDDFFCSICNNLMYKNFQCTNGHIYCVSCTETIKGKNGGCPECRVDFNTTSINRYLERQINKLKIFCPNKFYNTTDYIADEKYGCKHECTIEELESHLKVCEHSFVKCPNNIDCVKIRKTLLDQHLKECDLIKVECELCKENLLKVNLQRHLDTECLKADMTCNCSLVLKRQDLQEHLSTVCSMHPVDCLYAKFGCTKKVPRCEIDDHTQKYNHHSIIIKKFDQLTLDLESAQKKLNLCSRKFQGIWTISNWQKRCIDTKKGEFLALPIEIGSRNFQIQLYPTGKTNSDGSVSLFVYNYSGSDVTATFSFEVLNKGIRKG